jgi:fatty acid desaturase
VDEVFEKRQLLDKDALRALQQRSNRASATRMVLHLGAIVVTSCAIVFRPYPVEALIALTVALSWMLSGIFAPFHECVHRTAFASRTLNAIGAWPTGILFCMAPATYHAFHFEHHRYTQNRDRDPEIMAAPDALSVWPDTLLGWLKIACGIFLLRLKYQALVRFMGPAPKAGSPVASWEPTGDRRQNVAWQSWIVAGFWIGLVGVAITVAPVVWWLLLAFLISHVWQNLWIASEHTGLPLEGTILARTRSVRSNQFVRWWVWNMNYHAEHHAWPGIPWHQLPAAHVQVKDKMDHFVSSYTALHSNVIHQRNMPSADASDDDA